MEITKKIKFIILFISFLEGGAVMFCELVGAKLVAPFFGTSLYVWASAIGLTLGSLAIGYFSGGALSRRFKSPLVIFWIFMVAGVFVLAMPVTAKWIMSSTINMSIGAGVTISMILFLCPPLILFGSMSPIIIKTLTKDAENAGRISGLVYSISTLGGILFTYLTGFYLLPTYGISSPALFFGMLIILLSLIFLLSKKKWLSATVILIIILLNPAKQLKGEKSDKIFKNRYFTEGILGQIKVVDHPYHTKLRGFRNARSLLVNNTNQTVMDMDNPDYSLWDYAFFFPAAASVFPEGSKALILGMGGGTLYKQYKRLGFDIDVAELDERIRDVSIKYFHVDKDASIVIDDARHYIRTTEKKYDIVTFDLFLSETPPSHLLTTECFAEVNEIMNPGGLLLINFYGFTTGDLGLASRSVYKTLQEEFDYVRMLVTPSKLEIARNLIFVASNKEHDFTNISYSEKPVIPIEISDLEPHFLNPESLSFDDCIILKDDVPVLEHLYAQAALEWRKASNVSYTNAFIKNKLKNFK